MTAFGREQVLADFDVSRETAAKLDLFVSELTRWQRVKNLVGAADLAVLWPRHIADSLQLIGLAPSGAWIDLGSGAGFPGLVAAILQPDTAVHLVESDQRKSAFLRHIARLAAPNVTIHAARIEDVLPRIAGPIAAISARAVAPLTQLLDWSSPLLMAGSVGLFPKGRTYAAELTQARECWRFDADLIPSRTDSAARIIRVHGFHGQER